MDLKTICLLFGLQCSACMELFPMALVLNSYNKSSFLIEYTFRLIRLDSNTYGYEIYSGKKLFIRQITIPGVPGNKGFQRKLDAEKVARLIIKKLSQGIMPPTIEKKEMDKLHVQY